MKNPIHVLAEISVNSDEVLDIKAYNREQAIMWADYATFTV